MSAPETDRIRAIYERDAPQYDRSMRFAERAILGDARQWACVRAEGDVLELAVGTGLNLERYSPAVRLTGIELSPAMLELARGRAARLGRDADLRLGDAQALEYPDASFDTVLCTYGLCTIPDDRAAVREAWRVLRAGGRLVLAEHVRSPRRGVRAVQHVLDPLLVRLQGDHLLREPVVHVRAAGFVVEELERSRLGIVECLTARKPADPAGPSS